MANSLQGSTSLAPAQATIRDRLSRLQQQVTILQDYTTTIENNLNNSPKDGAKEGIEISPPVGIDKWIDQLNTSLDGVGTRLELIANRI